MGFDEDPVVLYSFTFPNQSPLLYIRKRNDSTQSIDALQFVPNQFYTSDPDLEIIATLVLSDKVRESYTIISHKDIMSATYNISQIKAKKHYMLIGGDWEIIGKIYKVHPNCIEILTTGATVYVSEFGLGMIF